jgi:DNA polymerase-3 subunit epsilon/ATP-dependent DNA helicase DinG
LLLRAAHTLAASDLAKSGISALAQGVDGSARQLVKALKSDPATVLFGTASFWEGVDIPGGNLSLLGITRLPFAVPTDPVQAARAGQYEDAFSEYRYLGDNCSTGIWPLIRTRTDKVAVVLDQRVVTKQYGQSFPMRPNCPVRTVPPRRCRLVRASSGTRRPRLDSVLDDKSRVILVH